MSSASHPRTSRRTFLGLLSSVSAGAALPSVVTSPTVLARQDESESAGEPDGPDAWPQGVPLESGMVALPGVIKSVDVASFRMVLSSITPGRSPASIDVICGQASCWRDKGTNLSSFREGDRVTVEGTWSGGLFVAQALSTMYDSRDDYVLDVMDDYIVATQGTYALTSQTGQEMGGAPERYRATDVRPGQSVSLLYRTDGSTGEAVLFKLGEVHSH